MSVVVRYNRVGPFIISGIGGTVIAVLIGTAVFPPGGEVGRAVIDHRDTTPSTRITTANGSLGGTSSSPNGSVVIATNSATAAGNNAPIGLRDLATCVIRRVPRPRRDGRAQTVDCPAVENRLPEALGSAIDEVSRNLAALRQQIAEANSRLAEIAVKPVADPNFVQNTILGPLRDRRIATLDRIALAIDRA